MPSCALVNCHCKAENGYSVHKLPLDEYKRNKWLEVIKKNSLQISLASKRPALCEVLETNLV